MFDSLSINAQWVRLAADIAIRDIQARYKRSLVGIAWIVLNPIAMLAIYWIVFAVVLKVTWRDPVTNQTVGFVLPFFAGLVFYLFFADVVVSSANLFVSKRNYVMKSAFPIWVLWLANLIRAGVTGLINVIILLLIALSEHGLSLAGLFWIVITLLIGALFASALSLLLSCLGPFIGDIGDAAELVLRVLFYTAPLTYPLEFVPESFRSLMWLNPLTHVIEPLRRAVVFSRAPEPGLLVMFTVSAALLLILSTWVFQRTRGVIADVV